MEMNWNQRLSGKKEQNNAEMESLQKIWFVISLRSYLGFVS